jgi:fructose-bisphosphate aldolase class II
MAFITLRQLLDHAAERGYGVPAFNINNMEQLLGIMAAAQKTASPVILQASRGARSYAGDLMLRAMVEAAVKTWPDVPVCLHLDHGDRPATCLSAIQHGFTSVMMDGSLEEDGKTPADYEYNVAVTAKVAELAHAVGVSVEGELGCLGSLETGHGEAEDGHGAEGQLAKSQLLTDPQQAQAFVAATGVDALAVAIGTSHGAYKFKRAPTGDILAMEVVRAIHALLPDTHLVMHGSSSVPEALQEKFNRFGGKMAPTWGVPVAEIQEGIRHGVRKINIDTDCRIAMAAEFRKVATEKPGEFDPRQFLKPATTALTALCAERFEQFNTAGQAPHIRPIPLAEMAKRYASGVLDPRTASTAKAA